MGLTGAAAVEYFPALGFLIPAEITRAMGGAGIRDNTREAASSNCEAASYGSILLVCTKYIHAPSAYMVVCSSIMNVAIYAKHR